MKKRILAALLAVAMLACSLAACSTSDTLSTTAPSTTGGSTADTTKATEPAPTEKPKETITLKLWGGVQPEYGYQELCDNFNKEYADKGIQVEYTRYVNDDNGNLQLETYLMGGDQIDIYMGYGGKTRLINRQEAGMAYDMTDYLTAHGFDPVEELALQRDPLPDRRQVLRSAHQVRERELVAVQCDHVQGSRYRAAPPRLDLRRI